MEEKAIWVCQAVLTAEPEKPVHQPAKHKLLKTSSSINFHLTSDLTLSYKIP